jgi:hypothetical protein
VNACLLVRAVCVDVAVLAWTSCPVCTAPDVTVAKLIKNHAFDSLFQRVSSEREKGG